MGTECFQDFFCHPLNFQKTNKQKLFVLGKWREFLRVYPGTRYQYSPQLFHFIGQMSLRKAESCSCSSQVFKGTTGSSCPECFPHWWKYDVPWTESQNPEGTPGNEAIPVILSGVCIAMMFVWAACSSVFRCNWVRCRAELLIAWAWRGF